MYRDLFHAYRKRILDQVPEIKVVEWDLGQDSRQNPGAMKATPAVLIRFLPTTTEGLASKAQQGVVSADIKVVTTSMYTDERRPGKPVGNSDPLDNQRIANEIHKALYGWSCKLEYIDDANNLNNEQRSFKLMNSLNRTVLSTDHDLGSFFRTTQRYQTLAKDFTVITNYIKPPSNPSFDMV